VVDHTMDAKPGEFKIFGYADLYILHCPPPETRIWRYMNPRSRHYFTLTGSHRSHRPNLMSSGWGDFYAKSGSDAFAAFEPLPQRSGPRAGQKL
jgi:hypothetical protein